MQQQQQAFQARLQSLGQASPSEIQVLLEKREIVQPETDLSPEMVARFQKRIRDASTPKR
ncbi:MAG: hypothetical protein IGR76_09285 [Synechococcales cyanobacterium T60_A2020_003]|nr:hypothetical protein [Synechococcales cyanobacterium T60_A2020_003]